MKRFLEKTKTTVSICLMGAWSLTLCMYSVVGSQHPEVDLTGRILTTSGNGANGLLVTLAGMHASDTTGPHGYFHLYQGGTGVAEPPPAARPGDAGVWDHSLVPLFEGAPEYKVAGQHAVVYTLTGRRLGSFHERSSFFHELSGMYMIRRMVRKVASAEAGLAKSAALPDTLRVSYRDNFLLSVEIDDYQGELPDLQLEGNIPIAHRMLVSDPVDHKVCIVNEQGANEKCIEVFRPMDVWQLANGNLMYNGVQVVKELSELDENQVVWEYSTATYPELWSVQPLPDGNLVLCVAGPPRILVVNREKEVLNSIDLHNFFPGEVHKQVRHARKTPQGTYYVAYFYANMLQEVSSTGEVLWSYPIDIPHKMVPLPNGNKFICTGAFRLVELDKQDSIVWELKASDFPNGFFTPPAGWWCYAQRRPNGNTLISSSSGDPMAFEVSPEKEVMWTMSKIDSYSLFAEMHVLDEEIDWSLPLK